MRSTSARSCAPAASSPVRHAGASRPHGGEARRSWRGRRAREGNSAADSSSPNSAPATTAPAISVHRLFLSSLAVPPGSLANPPRGDASRPPRRLAAPAHGDSVLAVRARCLGASPLTRPCAQRAQLVITSAPAGTRARRCRRGLSWRTGGDGVEWPRRAPCRPPARIRCASSLRRTLVVPRRDVSARSQRSRRRARGWRRPPCELASDAFEVAVAP